MINDQKDYSWKRAEGKDYFSFFSVYSDFLLTTLSILSFVAFPNISFLCPFWIFFSAKEKGRYFKRMCDHNPGASIQLEHLKLKLFFFFSDGLVF